MGLDDTPSAELKTPHENLVESNPTNTEKLAADQDVPQASPNKAVEEADELVAALSAIVDKSDSKPIENLSNLSGVDIGADSAELSAATVESQLTSASSRHMGDASLPADTSTSTSSTVPPTTTKKEGKAKRSKSKKSSQQSLPPQQPPPPPLPHQPHQQQMVPLHQPHIRPQQPHMGMTGAVPLHSQPNMQPIAPHPGVPAQPIMFIQQQGGPMVHHQQMAGNVSSQPMSGQIVMATAAPQMQYAAHNVHQAHPMPMQQGVPRGMPPQATNQVRHSCPIRQEHNV